MGKTVETKKLYTPSGKRKFKAKVIDSSPGTHELFAHAGTPSGGTTNPDILQKLRFRMSDHDYRKETQENTTQSLTTETTSENPATAHPLHQPGSDFHMSSDDFRVEEK